MWSWSNLVGGPGLAYIIVGAEAAGEVDLRRGADAASHRRADHAHAVEEQHILADDGERERRPGRHRKRGAGPDENVSFNTPAKVTKPQGARSLRSSRSRGGC